MRGEPRAFTLAELMAAEPCIHSVRDQGCVSCVRSILWYQGRVDGLKEAATLLATNTALVDAMREAVVEAEKRDPPAFYNDRLIDRPPLHGAQRSDDEPRKAERCT